AADDGAGGAPVERSSHRSDDGGRRRNRDENDENGGGGGDDHADDGDDVEPGRRTSLAEMNSPPVPPPRRSLSSIISSEEGRGAEANSSPDAASAAVVDGRRRRAGVGGAGPDGAADGANIDAEATAGPQNDGSRSAAGAAAGGGTPAVPPARAAVPPPTERQRKIAASVLHRRQLLAWIRASRTEARTIRGDYARGSRRGFAASVLGCRNHGSDEQRSERERLERGAALGNLPPVLAKRSSSSYEVEDFATISSMAHRNASSLKSAALKRARSASTGAAAVLADPPPSPRELRKGSGVGRKMTSAASALAGAGGWISSTSSEGGGGTGGTKEGGGTTAPAAAAAAPPPLGTSSPLPSPAAASSKTAHATKDLRSPGKEFHRRPLPAGEKKWAAPAGEKPPGEKPPKKKWKRSGLKKNVEGGASNHNLKAGGGAGSGGGPTKAPLNHVKGALPSGGNVRAGASKPSMSPHELVPSGAAMALLERRKDLATRLDDLLRKRHRAQCGKARRRDADGDDPSEPASKKQKVEGVGDGSTLLPPAAEASGGPSLASKASPQTASSLRRSPSNQSSTTQQRPQPSKTTPHWPPRPPHLHPPPLMPPPPPRLPPRRKTQWDLVLEEMRWMAADFAEERKWKAAAGRSLSSAAKASSRPMLKRIRRVRSSGSLRSAASSRTRTPGSLSSRGSSSAASRSQRSHRSSRSRSGAALRSTGSAPSSGQILDDDADPLYVDATREDSERARRAARTMSVAVRDRWDRPASGGDVAAPTGDARLRKLRRGSGPPSAGVLVERVDSSVFDAGGSDGMMDRDPSPLRRRSSSSDVACREMSDGPKRPGLSYDEISRHVDLSRERVNASGDVAMQEDASERERIVGGIRLGLGQSRVVRRLERLWEETPTSAATQKKTGSNTAAAAAASAMKNSAAKNACGGGTGGERINAPLHIMDVGEPPTFQEFYGVAAVLGGGLGVGKTVVACSLMWMNRERGAQLIVCSAASLMRWKHELDQFDGLNVFIHGGSPNSDNRQKWGPSNIVVCAYELLAEMASLPDRGGRNSCHFASLTLDLRHPLSADSGWQSASPVDSAKFWIHLNEFVARCCRRGMKRLIIEPMNPSSSRFNLVLEENSGNDGGNENPKDEGRKRHRSDEMLAMRVAFLYNPSIFFSELGPSIGKRVVSWAKRQGRKARSDATMTMKMAARAGVGEEDKIYSQPHLCNGSNSQQSSLPRSRSVLMALLQTVYDSTINLPCLDESRDEEASKCGRHNGWELRACSLSQPQRAVYESCCYDMVQGRVCSNQGVAECLLKLRKICLHSNLDGVIERLLASLQCDYLGKQIRGSSCGSTLFKRIFGTFSEPNIDVAKRVMKKSSKMKELLCLLTGKCGHNVESKSELLEDGFGAGVQGLEGFKRNKARKVLILATLVEAQLLTSLFLSAVGLHHEVLVSLTNKAKYHAPAVLTSTTDEYSMSSWAWSQELLSQFDHTIGGGSGSMHRAVDILIASPKAISSQNCGLSASSAEFVISIDEDWSGREAIHQTSTVSKILTRHGLGRGTESCTFIKLICENTCEDSFLCKGNTTDAAKSAAVSKRDHRANCTVATRRSRRVASKGTDEAESDSFNKKCSANGSTATETLPNSVLLRPIVVKPGEASINSDGFLVPPQNHRGSNMKEILVGSNVSRYRNSKLSSVLCYALSDLDLLNSDILFLPIEGAGKQLHHQKSTATANHRDVAFAWSLFMSEDDASSISTLKLPSTSHHLREYAFELESIALGPANAPLPFEMPPSCLYHYIESFKTSPCFISQEWKQPRLFDIDGSARASSNCDTLCNVNPNSPSNDQCQKEGRDSGGDNVKLLVYELPPIQTSKKHKNPDNRFSATKSGRFNFDLPAIRSSLGGSAPHNVYSFCFSWFDSSSTFSAHDGNQGCEPLVYLPSFLSHLLRMVQKNTTPSSPHEDAASRTKRNVIEGPIPDIDSKRLRLSDSSFEELLSANASPLFSELSQDDVVPIPDAEDAELEVGPTADLLDERFSVVVETNSSSSQEYRSNEDGNAELIFHRKLLASDLRGAFSCCQSRPPALNSFILISKKRQQLAGDTALPARKDAVHIFAPSESIHSSATDTRAGKKLLPKKNKGERRVLDEFLPTQNDCGASYFGNDHLFSRPFSSRTGIASESISSLIGQVRIQFMLNDLASSKPDKSDMQQIHLSLGPLSTQRSVGQLPLLGTLPCLEGDESLHPKERNHGSGITLPAGVKAPCLAKSLSSSPEELSEPWTDAEDKVLQESLARYGTNWHLAARAVSLRVTSLIPTPDALSNGSGSSLGHWPRRSPAQCQNRWESLKSDEPQAASSSLPAARNEAINSTALEASAAKEVPRFGVEQKGGGLRDSVIFDSSSSLSLSKADQHQSSSFRWLGTSRPASSAASTSTQTASERRLPLTSRIQMLRDLSKKRRVATMPMPASMPTHASHTESIQAARANMLAAANGVAPPRHEMWPLELLDYIKKQKSAPANQHAHQRDIPRGSAAPHHPVHPSSQSPHRQQQSSAPYHPPPHNVHPTQHQMYRPGAGQMPNHQHPPYHQGRAPHHHAGVNPTVAYQKPPPRMPPRHHHRSSNETKKGS
ncbi:hypothetical protein ACHAWF_017722, partial [Thalassiosira exigua]